MSEIVEKTFIVSSPARLVVTNIRGSVDIRPSDEGSIRITAVKQNGFGDPRRTEVEIIQESDGTVKATTRFPDAGWGWIIGSFPCQVDYTVYAPPQCSLRINGVSSGIIAGGFTGEFNLRTVSGDVDVRNLQGPVKVDTVSGRMDLADLTGEIRLHTVSGRIDGRHLDGSLRVETISGKVDLDESRLPSAEVTTVSGGIDIQTALGDGPYHFNSVSGNIQMMVPANFALLG